MPQAFRHWLVWYIWRWHRVLSFPNSGILMIGILFSNILLTADMSVLYPSFFFFWECLLLDSGFCSGHICWIPLSEPLFDENFWESSESNGLKVLVLSSVLTTVNTVSTLFGLWSEPVHFSFAAQPKQLEMFPSFSLGPFVGWNMLMSCDFSFAFFQGCLLCKLFWCLSLGISVVPFFMNSWNFRVPSIKNLWFLACRWMIVCCWSKECSPPSTQWTMLDPAWAILVLFMDCTRIFLFNLQIEFDYWSIHGLYFFSGS